MYLKVPFMERPPQQNYCEGIATSKCLCLLSDNKMTEKIGETVFSVNSFFTLFFIVSIAARTKHIFEIVPSNHYVVPFHLWNVLCRRGQQFISLQNFHLHLIFQWLTRKSAHFIWSIWLMGGSIHSGCSHQCIALLALHKQWGNIGHVNAFLPHALLNILGSIHCRA